MFEWIPWLNKKCFICEQRDENVLKFASHSWDATRRYHYCHKSCLGNLVRNPSNNTRINSIAISILERLALEESYLKRTQTSLREYNPDKKLPEGEKENV